MNLADIEAAVLDTQRRYNLAGVYYDPHQAAYLAQRLRERGVNMVPVPFTTKALVFMAERLLRSFRNRMIDLYPHDDLLRDLGKLNIVEKKYGVRIDAPNDADGHCDLGTAFAIVNGIAIEYLDELHENPSLQTNQPAAPEPAYF